MSDQTDSKVAQLEAILSRQLAEHQQLLSLIGRKRQAVRRADHRLVVDCCRQENRRVQKIGELEKARLSLTGELTLMLAPGVAEPMRLRPLAELVSEPARGRLLVLRQQLCSLMAQVRRDAGVAQRATETLARHMQGIVQTISGAIGGGAAYGRAGAPPRPAMSFSTLNMTA